MAYPQDRLHAFTKIIKFIQSIALNPNSLTLKAIRS